MCEKSNYNIMWLGIIEKKWLIFRIALQCEEIRKMKK